MYPMQAGAVILSGLLLVICGYWTFDYLRRRLGPPPPRRRKR
jgi:hypothetical protein